MNDTVVTLKPILDLGVDALAGILLASGSWALTWVCNHFKLAQDAHLNDMLHAALERGVNYAVQKLQAVGADHTSINVRSALVADAVNYVEQFLPDVVGKFGLTSADVQRLVLAHLPDLSNSDPSAASDAPGAATPAAASAEMPVPAQAGHPAPASDQEGALRAPAAS